MHTSGGCDDYLTCENYLSTAVADNCSVCSRRRMPEGYAQQIIEADARELADELEEKRRANPELALFDAKADLVKQPRIKHGGKV